jgi:hypothetical protein
MNPKRWLWALLVAAAIGLGVFGIVVSRVTTAERVTPSEVTERFEAIRARFEDPRPMLTMGPGGEIERRPPPTETATRARVLHVTAYRGPLEGLVQVDVPLWFLRMKGPALRYVLRDTGIDLRALGLTARDLERYGPAIVMDEVSGSGDRVLVWTEAKE